MSKLFTVAGTSRKNGVIKVRWTNDLKREKALEKDGQTDIILIELPEPMDKVEAAKTLLTLSMYESGEAYDAIAEFLTGEGVPLETVLRIGSEVKLQADVETNEDVDVETDDGEDAPEVDTNEDVDVETNDEEPVEEVETEAAPAKEQISEEDQEMLKKLMQYS